MTEREEARTEAALALRRVTDLRNRGDRIAEAWRKSREDNNFRMMLRQLGERVANNGSS